MAITRITIRVLCKGSDANKPDSWRWIHRGFGGDIGFESIPAECNAEDVAEALAFARSHKDDLEQGINGSVLVAIS